MALGACGDDLLPGEVVLGAERSATFVYGEPGDRLGEAVAWDGTAPASAAPGRPALWRDGWSDGPSAWVGFWGAHEVRVGPGAAWLDGAAVDEAWVPKLVQAEARAASALGVFTLADGVLHRVDTAQSVDVPDATALAADTERVVVLTCADSEPCGVAAFDGDLQPLGAPAAPDGSLLLGGSGGAVALDEGVVCVGDPRLDLDEGAGEVRCEDGRGAVGEPGDHLGTTLAAGHAAGTFNRRLLPPRARIVPLDGGEVLVLDVGAEGQPLYLAGDAGTVVVGAPYHPHGGAPAGALVWTSR